MCAVLSCVSFVALVRRFPVVRDRSCRVCSSSWFVFGLNPPGVGCIFLGFFGRKSAGGVCGAVLADLSGSGWAAKRVINAGAQRAPSRERIGGTPVQRCFFVIPFFVLPAVGGHESQKLGAISL